MTITETLIRNLEERAREEGTWTVTADELSDRYDPVEFYRAVYAAGQVSTQVYGPDNAGELLVLIDHLTGRDYRTQFRAAGLVLNHEDRIDLTGRFARIMRRAVILHVPEPETFRAMLRQFRRYDRAQVVYLGTFFDTDELVRACTDEYLDARDAPALRSTVESYLRLLLQRHIVDLHELAPALFDILRTVARHEGMLPGGRGADDDRPGPDPADDRRSEIRERSEALRVLGFSGSGPTRNEIRDSYRRLMRQYHPDVNPDGLEKAKLINGAYALLMTGSDGE